MKNEEFDEAIRKKLESLNQTYTDSDIDKVHRQVLKQRRFPRKGSTGSWLLYSLSAAAFTTVTLWSVSHFRSEKQVVFANDSLTRQIVAAPSDSGQTPEDTLVVGGLLSKETENIKTQTVPKIKQGIKAGEPEIPAAKQNKSADQSPDRDQNKTMSQTQDKTIAALPPDIYVAAHEPANEVIQPMVSRDDQPQIPVPVAQDEAKIVIRDSDSTKETASIPAADVIQVKKEETKNEITESKPAAFPNAKNNDTIPIGKTGENEGNQVKFFKDVKIRTGVNFQVSNQSIAYGLSGELIFGRHFGFQTGLNYRLYQEQHFADQKDFLNHRPPDHHHHWIDDHLSDKEHISDVTISNSLLQVPVTFSYYLPLKRNFTVSFALGTDMDIYLHQKLSYTDHADSVHHRDDFQDKGDVSLLNTFTFSAGAGKQWKSWLFEVKPYISPKFTGVFYKPEEMEFGVEVGVKYCFGK